jgi:hypothetical protein
VSFDDCLAIFESTFTLLLVIIVVVVERLPQQIQTMEVVQSFNISRISSTVLFTYFDLIYGNARFLCL